MNKKGFTLVEIIVTITLIALIGIVIGVSLTKTIKIQEDTGKTKVIILCFFIYSSSLSKLSR